MEWQTLHDPNVLLLLGAMTEGQFMMVSKWMEDGNIMMYVEANANADRLELVCFIQGLCLHLSLMTTQLLQLKGATRGLIYMHGQERIHGDLKGVCAQTLYSPCYRQLT